MASPRSSAVPTSRPRRRTGLALALGGGAARGLAHIGVLEVLEQADIRPDFIAGSSMGGLIGALAATGLAACDIREIAQEFRFPRRFLPGGMLRWESLFRSALGPLAVPFDQLETPLAVTAADLETGGQAVIHTGPLLPAVRATCSVPGVLPPVRLGGRWLVDGGLVNVLPVDVAWISNPDVVVAVQVGAARARKIPHLDSSLTRLLTWVGQMVPNPATAKASFEILIRAAEILMDRQMALAAAMTGPEVLIEPELGDLGLRDFHRLPDAVDAGRRAAEAAMPELLRRLDDPEPRGRGDSGLTLRSDPVCSMVINPARARSRVAHQGRTYYFCSVNCQDCFERNPGHYLGLAPIDFDITRMSN